MAASSIHGTGAQNLPSAARNGCAEVSGIAFGPDAANLPRASALLRPPAGGAGDAGGEPATFVAGLGSITVAEVMMDRLLWQITGCDDIRPAFTRVFPASESGSIHCFGRAEGLRKSRSGSGRCDGWYTCSQPSL